MIAGWAREDGGDLVFDRPYRYAVLHPAGSLFARLRYRGTSDRLHVPAEPGRSREETARVGTDWLAARMDEAMIERAIEVGTGADCTRRTVGAVLYDHAGREIFSATNAYPYYERRSCLGGECPRGRVSTATLPSDTPGYGDAGAQTYCGAWHAERWVRTGTSLVTQQGGTLAVSHEPCHQCRAEDLPLMPISRVIWPGGSLDLVDLIPARSR